MVYLKLARLTADPAGVAGAAEYVAIQAPAAVLVPPLMPEHCQFQFGVPVPEIAPAVPVVHIGVGVVDDVNVGAQTPFSGPGGT